MTDDDEEFELEFGDDTTVPDGAEPASEFDFDFDFDFDSDFDCELDSVLETLRSRLDVIDAVQTTPQQKPDLQRHLDVSRSTVNRAITELETAGLLTREADGYALTSYGRLLASRYESFLRKASEITAASGLLERLPATTPLAFAFLENATVHRATSPAPHRPVTHFEELLDDADRLRGISPTISQSTTPQRIGHRVSNGMHGELVVSAELAGYMYDNRREEEAEMIRTGRYRLLGIESVPYGLALLEIDGETIAVAFIYDETNDLLGTIVNDTPAAVAWAERLYERYRDAAEDISDHFLDGTETDADS